MSVVSIFVTNPFLFYGILFIGLVLSFGFVELRWGARPMPRRANVLRDVLAALFYVVVVAQAAHFLNRWIGLR